MGRPLLALLLLGLGLLLGAVAAFVVPRPAAPQAIEWLSAPRSLASFRLESDRGAFTHQSLRGRWSIVLFGFMHCPDICPTGLTQMAGLAARLVELGDGAEIAFVFVSVDPQRDSVAEVGQFVRHFDASFRGVTGSEEQLLRLASRLGIQFAVSPEPDGYTVAHSLTFSIIDPQGRFVGRFRPGFAADHLARELSLRF
ncbi:SCO family protein [Pseudomonas sp. SG20056]|uniref:SCO family protein n=1 Tax=Pseudomonas sp. SG20056 TaxID=3074146 RepID=UPI00287FD019|nr:SCO family protein [Pseudomonas sp. SG20056]WNF47061.1 SCO family protein [Pseudomonas sp. SG20056]